jgi:hypothetical protein
VLHHHGVNPDRGRPRGETQKDARPSVETVLEKSLARNVLP